MIVKCWYSHIDLNNTSSNIINYCTCMFSFKINGENRMKYNKLNSNSILLLSHLLPPLQSLHLLTWIFAFLFSFFYYYYHYFVLSSFFQIFAAQAHVTWRFWWMIKTNRKRNKSQVSKKVFILITINLPVRLFTIIHNVYQWDLWWY